MSKFVFLASLILLPIPAYAYLDPGSGNALVYLLVSLFGAISYFLKSTFYRILSFIRGEKIEARTNDDIVIFSEGSNYWLTYKPIIEAFIERKIPFSYITMDVTDPALTIENDYMHSKYIGEGSVGFSKVAHWPGLVMLTTTPNIGCPGFPLPKPMKIKCLAHIWHSVCDTGFYHLGALDHYDAALTVGPWVEESIRYVEKARNLKKKEVLAVGLPYLDELSLNAYKKRHPSERKKILIAPSWGQKNCLAVYGTKFLIQLAEQDYDIIVRPHPQSLKVEKEFIQEIQKELSDFKNVRFDFDISGTQSMAEADLLISDKSSIRFDFAFLYEKPVLTLDIPFTNLNIYEASLFNGLWEEGQSRRIGMRLTPEDKEKIVASVKKALLLHPSNIRVVREETISHWQQSGSIIAEWVIQKVNDLKINN